jgi:hypothetical protein
MKKPRIGIELFIVEFVCHFKYFHQLVFKYFHQLVFRIENIFHRLRIVCDHGKALCMKTFTWGLVIDMEILVLDMEILVQVTGDFHRDFYRNFLLQT